MVPKEKILEKAKEINADVIGLSGLITPSLDEMVDVAKAMQDEGMKIPLLIGGATTSKIHTAVKIDPAYDGPVVHVHDASKSVPVASALLGEEGAQYHANVKTDYAEMRENHANRKQNKTYIPYTVAKRNKYQVDWGNYEPKQPKFLGEKVFEDFDLNILREYIDWTPFFSTWMLKGKYPKIFENEVIGEEAKKLFADANKMLDEVIKEGQLKAKAIIGLLPANTVDDDVVEVYTDESRTEVKSKFHFLRQQGKKAKNIPNISLADFIAPKESGVKDYIGCFAVTAGIGIEPIIEKYDADHDDYNSIMIKAIADRLAEAFAEAMHELVRKDYWGYASSETLDNEALIKESYQGIRPAPGYPACPDHTEKPVIWDMMDIESKTGIELTDSFAMYPASSVSGFYIANPESKYFGLGKVEKDQVEFYAESKGVDLAVMEKWLAPNLNYDI